MKSIKQPYNSAPIVNSSGSPAFTVLIDGKPTTFTAHQVAVRYLKVLLSYATDFLGRKITGAVLAIPSNFNKAQIEALKAASEEAGIKVLQTVTEAAAALTAYHSTLLVEEDKKVAGAARVDRNSVVVDVGGSSTTVTVVAVRDGLFAPLATVHDSALGGDLFDAKLMDWFSKEFTKKTRIALTADNHRALMKLRLSVEVTKKSLSASNTAPCSVESLAEGMDFHGSVNRMRFDLLSASIYAGIVSKVEEALKAAKVDPVTVNEVSSEHGMAEMFSDRFCVRLFSLEEPPDCPLSPTSSPTSSTLPPPLSSPPLTPTRSSPRELPSKLSPSSRPTLSIPPLPNLPLPNPSSNLTSFPPKPCRTLSVSSLTRNSSLWSKAKLPFLSDVSWRWKSPLDLPKFY